MIRNYCVLASIHRESGAILRIHRRFGWLIGAAFVVLALTGCAQSTKADTPKQPQRVKDSALLSTAKIKHNIGSDLVSTLKDQQASTTASLRDKLASGNYTADHMYVALNPYGTSPLSALALFKTNDAVKVSYTVVGKTAKTSVTNQIPGYSKSHTLPIVGLYAGYNNTVKIRLTAKNGTVTTKTIFIQTQALAKNLAQLKLSVTKADKTKMQLGQNQMTFLIRSTQRPFAVDADGAIRWYSDNYAQHIYKQLSNGHIILMNKKDNHHMVYNDLIETDYLGRVYRQYHISNTTKSTENIKATTQAENKQETTVIHHDVIELPNHNLLATVSDGSKYVEDTIVEISHKTGKVVKVLDIKRILPKKMWQKYTSSTRTDGKVDWLHNNALYYDRTDKSLVISSRHQDLVMKMDYKTGNIKWLFSGKKVSDWPKAYRPFVLKATKGTTITGGQHAAYLLADHDGNAHTKDLLLYDNNYAVTNGDRKTSGKYSQAVQYTVNEKHMTIKQNWAYGKQLGQANFTDRIGNSQRLSQGNHLIDFGYLNAKDGTGSNVIEVAGNQPVFNLHIDNIPDKGYVYRAYRQPLFPSNYAFHLS